MPAYTLLDYVQAILSSMDSDEVNSYDDTTESLQVTKVVQTVYNDIQARLDLPEQYSLFALEASGDINQPVLMTRPSDMASLIWVMYDKIRDDETNSRYESVTFLPVDKFLQMSDRLNADDDAVLEMTFTVRSQDFTFKYRNDLPPTWYTTWDDLTFVFDSYDSAVDSTLQSDKTRCYGRRDWPFTLSNTFVPFIDPEHSTLLLNEAKVLAFGELKQVGHEKAEQWARRGWTKVQKSKRGINQERTELDRAPNYGRR